MLVTPTLFMTAVSGLIRMGAAGRKMFIERAQSRDIDVIVSLFEADNSRFPMGRQAELEALALNHAFGYVATAPELLTAGGAYDKIFTPDCILRQHTPELLPDCAAQRDQMQALIDRFFETEIESRLDPQIRARIAMDATADPRVTFLHKDWLTGEGPARGWRRFGLELAGATLDVIGADPKMMGLDGKADKLLRALIPSFNNLVDARLLNDGGDEQPGERLIKTFMRGAVSAVAQHPDMVTSEERWKPVVGALLTPLAAEVESAAPGADFLTQKRLGELLKGPMLTGALGAINANADAFLKGGARGDKVLGAVSRTLLSDMVADPSQSLGFADLFSQHGVIAVYNSALKTAARRPDLFIRGDGLETEAAREMLTGVADALQQSAIPPFRLHDGVGADIAGIMFDVAVDYTDQRLRLDIDGDLAPMWSEICVGVMRDILRGFERGLAGKDMAIFEKLFSRDQALDIVKIMARQVAATPQMVLKGRVNPEIVNIAQAVAEAVASDEMKLMGAQDWRSLISVMLGAASKNPGVLFSLDDNGDFSDQLASTLISHVMGKAQATLSTEGRAQGRILFGETLRDALIATLQAANANLKASIMTSSADGGRAHVAALGGFIDQLNAYAAQTEDAHLAMTADEWLHVYKFYVAHILENGYAATARIGPEQVKAVLRDDYDNATVH